MRYSLAVLCALLLGKEVPDYDPKLVFSDNELRFLYIYAAHFKQPELSTLREAMLLISLLGGFRDSHPEHEPREDIMACGMVRLSGAVIGLEIHDREWGEVR